MIKRLRSKFMINAMIAFLVAMFALVFFLNLFITLRFTDVIDGNLDRIMEMELDDIEPPDGQEDPIFRGFNERVFIVYFDEDLNITETIVSNPNTIPVSDANQYASSVVTNGRTRGWADGYRYVSVSDGTETVYGFIDGDFFGYAITSFRNISLIALAVTTILVIVFLYFASKQAVKPMVQSQERQKQFMTDASHELKTPLTVISANTEIMRMNDPDNEWLISIDKQTRTLTHLIQQIIKMSKLDESELELIKEDVNISDIVNEAIEDFSIMSNQKNLEYAIEIEDDIIVYAHKQSIKELVSILVDNAMKYCDENGDLQVKLYKNKKVHFWIANQYNQIDKLNLSKIFNRFYRADSARLSDGSFGLGLSIASSIVEYHHGYIKANKVNHNQIAIEVILP